MNKFKNIFKQAFHFFLVSGVGWCLDFSLYLILTKIFGFKVSYANMISSIPAITYVFIMSNKKIFSNKKSKINLKYKYIIYFIYQIILVTLMSFLGEKIFNVINNTKLVDIIFIQQNIKILVKILITPITMFSNFIVMKNLIEKI